VKVAALQCLVKIMSLYYQYMEHYMGLALFAITMQAMKDERDEIALQGIEFWSNVCDEEIDLSIEAAEAAEQGRPPLKTSRFYAKGALQYLVPILMQSLTKQEEHDDEDDWNPCKAAGVCLMLMATCCEDNIVQHVLPFVNQNIQQPDWRYREAAVMAFGSILEGPDPNSLQPIVEQALPMLLKLMEDKSVVVRDTVAWALGRICETIPNSVLSSNLEPLLHTLVAGLASEPRVAVNICWAFNSLAEAAYQAVCRSEDEEPPTYSLSRYFEAIVAKLLETTERSDGGQSNLRFAAYEALMELIKNSPRDCYACVQNATMVILQRLQHVLTLEPNVQSSSDRAQYNDLQSLLCATLQSVLRKMTPEDAPRISDIVMRALIGMFDVSGKAGSVQEDALMAVSTLVEVLGESFVVYMDAFRPYLAMGLKNHAEYQVCVVAVGLVGDICRSLGSKVIPYCDEMMQHLTENLANQHVHRSMKPQILSVFGDIALATGIEFVKYLSVVLEFLAQAAQCPMDKNDPESVDYVTDLRENIMEAYTGIVQGLKGDLEQPNPQIQLLQPQLSFIMQFILAVASDSEVGDSLIAATAGLIGDLCNAFGHAVLPIVEFEPVSQLLLKGKRSKINKTKTLSNWALKESKKLKLALSNATNTIQQNTAQVLEQR
jgi:importin subunit beta-1